MSFKAYTLFSGSGGNCIFVRRGDTRILIDMGKSARAVERALAEIGEDPASISAIFITHEHCDHTRGLDVFTKKRPIPIHITEPSAMAARGCDLARSLFVTHNAHGFEETVGDLRIRAFEIPHDSAANVGYIISPADVPEAEAERVGVATDIGFVTDTIKNSLCGCRYVILESNHDPFMLRTGPYPAQLKRRIASRGGHLSNEECAVLAAQLADAGTCRFLLAHLSKENNEPRLACSAVGSALGCALCGADCPPEAEASEPLYAFTAHAAAIADSYGSAAIFDDGGTDFDFAAALEANESDWSSAPYVAAADPDMPTRLI